MIKTVLNRKIMFSIILSCLIPALACNFPFKASQSGSSDDLRQTLTAFSPPIPGEETPVPVKDANQGESLNGGIPTESGSTINYQKPEILHLDGSGQWYTYLAHSGDTLAAVAKRFAVDPDEIDTSQPISEGGFLSLGQELRIPNRVGEIRYAEFLFPDSEIINSPLAKDFNIHEYVENANGYLNTYGEMVKGNWLSGADIVRKVAQENSINPRILLALLEFRSGWVFSSTGEDIDSDYPIGFLVPEYKGLYYELVLTATHLGVGYYGWRTGERAFVSFPDGGLIRLNPGLNPGTVAVQNLVSKLSNQEEWRESLYEPGDFISLYMQMYGDPWMRAAQVKPIFPDNLEQPILELPFSPGERWSFTGGPHRSWNAGSPRGALDFSPVTGEPPCTTSRAWVTASAEGHVTRASDSVVSIDLDGDGYEQTGWVLVYLHLAELDAIALGSLVSTDGLLGHPSCERGNSTGTHVHLARKYNGEWIPADGAVPFVLSGWQVHGGERSYQGELRKGADVVTANPGGPSSSLIIKGD
jgi:murein DD-endopeptidase MepM/ murein hydrolase activator NlpD